MKIEELLFRPPSFEDSRLHTILHFNRTKLGISLEPPKVRVVAVRKGQAMTCHETTLPSDSFHNGFLAAGQAGQEAGQQIREFLKQEGLPLEPLRVAIPGHQSFTRALEVSTTVRTKDMNSTVRREARRLLALSLDNSYLSWQSLSNLSQSPLRNIYMVVVPRKPLDNTVQALTSARLRVSSVDLRPLAVARAIDVHNGIIGHSDLHGGDAVVVVGGIPTLVRSFYWGDQPLSVEYACIRAAEEFARTISFFNDSTRGKPLDQNLTVCLTGPLAKEEALTTNVATATGRRVTKPHFFQTFEASLGMMKPPFASEH